MAKKFQFRLEVVRKLRRRQRDEQRRKVAEAVRAVTAVERQIEVFMDSLRGTVSVGREEQSQLRLNLGHLRTQRFYQSWLHRKIIEANEELATKHRTLDVEREKLGRVNARFKAIEKLKERKWQRHREEVARQERVAFDEIAVQQFQRIQRQERIEPATEVLIA